MTLPDSTIHHGATALSIKAVCKQYTRPRAFGFGRRARGAEMHALRDINLDIRQGETVGLLGPNGSGKTTLLKTIATLLEPTSGQISLYGTDISRQPHKVRGRIGLVTCDERSFYWRLSGRENLSFFGALYGLTAAKTHARAELLLRMLGLEHAADRPFQSYSSGMKQKLAIARGLLSEPELILYDEPTRSLDPLSASHIRKWLLDTRPQHPSQTNLIATNQLQEAEQLCDRVLIISRGVILASGTVDEIREAWNQSGRETYEIVYTGPVSDELVSAAAGPGIFTLTPDPSRLGCTAARFDSSESDNRLSRIIAAIVEAGGSVQHCQSERASFDQIFCSMVEQSQPAGGSAK